MNQQRTTQTEVSCARPFCVERRPAGESLALCPSCQHAAPLLSVFRMLVDPMGYLHERTQDLLNEKRGAR